MQRFDKQRLEMLKEIMMIDFALVELNLFLDTHPNDRRALADYNRYGAMSRKLKQEYQRCYGPLTANGAFPAEYPWRWIYDPWPWEIEY